MEALEGSVPLVAARLEAPALGVRLPRPENRARALLHVTCGTVAFLCIQVLPGRAWLVGVSGAFAVFAWSCETARRRSERVNDALMRLFARVAHAHERHHPNSSTWYATALLLLSLFAPMRAAAAAVVVLAIADPIAAFVGRRVGRTRLRAGRSLEGTLAFVVAGTLAAFATLALFDGLALPTALLVAGAAAVAGAIAELVSTRLDDNFTIPLAAAAAAALVLALV